MKCFLALGSVFFFLLSQFFVVIAVDIKVPAVSSILPPSFTSNFEKHVATTSCVDVDPLTCWLESLSFKIPDTCFDVEGKECCISDFVCDGIELEGISSSYITPTSLFMSINNLGTTCSGKWSYGILDGDLTATISRTTIETTAFVEKVDLYPVSLQFHDCSVPSIDIELKFSGGLVGWILQLISSKVEEMLEGAVNKVFCEELVTSISNKMTEALVTTIDPALKYFVDYKPPATPSLPVDKYINWKNELPFILGNLVTADKVNSFVNSVTESTGTVVVGLNDHTIVFPIVDPTSGPLGTVTLILHTISMNGLNAFTNVNLLQPSLNSDFAIKSEFELSHLNCTLDVTVKVELDQKSVSGLDLTENFAIELDMKQIKFMSEFLLAVDKVSIESLYLDQLRNDGFDCILTATDYLNFTNIDADVKFRKFAVSQADASGLEADIDNIINNALRLVLEGFPELTSSVFSGIVNGPVRDSLNSFFHSLKSSAMCGPHNEIVDPEYIVWSENHLINSLNEFINIQVGPSGVNNYVNKLTDNTGEIVVLNGESFVASLFGLNTFTKFLLLSPHSDLPYALDSEFSLGYCEGHGKRDACTPLGLTVFKQETGSEAELSKGISVNLFNFNLNFDVDAKFDTNSFNNLQFQDLFSQTGCLMSCFKAVELTDIESSISESTVQKGSLPGKDITDAIQKVIDGMTSEAFVNHINEGFKNLLSDATSACESGVWPPDDSDDDSNVPTCVGPLECALQKIAIGPFNFCFDVSIYNQTVELCVDNLVCSGITLSDLSSDYISPSSFQAGVGGLGITCDAGWSVGLVVSENKDITVYSGDLSVSMSDFTSSIVLTLAHYAKTELPTEIKFSDCSVSSVNFDVHFSGSAIGEVLDTVVAPSLETALISVTDNLVCDLLPLVSDAAITLFLDTKLNPKLKTLIVEGQVKRPPPDSTGYVAWSDTLLQTFQNLLGLFDQASGDVMSCMANAVSPYFANDKKINSILEFVTHSVAKINIDINEEIDFGSNSSILIKTLSIDGLKTFDNLTLLVPSPDSGVTLTSTLDIASLELKLSLEVRLPENYIQDVVVDLQLSDISLLIDAAVALNKERFDQIFLDQVLDFGCIGSAFDFISIYNLGVFVDVDSLNIKQIMGGDATPLEKETVEFINNGIELVLHNYPITDILAGVAQTTIRTDINEKIAALFKEYESTVTCRSHGNYTEVDYVVWSTSTIIQAVDKLFNTVIGPDGLNKFIDCVTDDTGVATIAIPEDASYLAGFTIEIGGLDSFFEFALVYPLENEPFDLGTVLGLGSCQESGSCKPLSLTLKGTTHGKPMMIQLSVQNIKFFMDFLLELDMNAMKNLNMGQYETEGCTMTTVEAAKIFNVNLTLSEAELVYHNGDSVMDITYLLDMVINKLLANGGLTSSFNDNLSVKMSEAEDKCAGTYSNDDLPISDHDKKSFFTWGWKLFLLMVGCALSLLALVYVYYKYGTFGLSAQCLSGNKVDENGKLIPIPEDPNSYSVRKIGNFIAAKFGYENYNFDALIAMEKIPLWLRLSFPLAVMGNIALFVAANIEVGVSVEGEIDYGDGNVIQLPTIFEFGLANTVRDMWNAGVYPLSVLIALFSGAWPYIKLVSMLICWILPSPILSVARRDSGLRWLDTLGKWSLIDAYVMVMMMVAFHVEVPVLGEMSILITVVPRSGFNNFLLATMSSLGLGHICLACHRLVTESKLAPVETEVEPLMNHVFTWGILSKQDPSTNSSFSSQTAGELTSPTPPKNVKIDNQKVAFTTFGKIVVTCSIIFMILFVLAGVIKNTYSFHFRGLVGLMLGDDADASYSLVSTGTTMAGATGNPNDFNVRWIQATFFGFGIVMPIGFLSVLLIVWLTPLTLNTFRQLVVLSEVCNAWNAIDVFVVAVLAALLEIQQFAEFLVGDSCDAINEKLAENDVIDEMLHGDDKCFDVIATVKTNFWIIVVAAVSMFVLGMPLMSLCHTSIHDRMCIPDNIVSDTDGQQKLLLDDSPMVDDENINVNVGVGGSDSTKGTTENGDLESRFSLGRKRQSQDDHDLRLESDASRDRSRSPSEHHEPIVSVDLNPSTSPLLPCHNTEMNAGGDVAGHGDQSAASHAPAADGTPTLCDRLVAHVVTGLLTCKVIRLVPV